MKISEAISGTWRDWVAVKTNDTSLEGIREVINREFDCPEIFENLEEWIRDGYLEIFDDGFIIWES